MDFIFCDTNKRLIDFLRECISPNMFSSPHVKSIQFVVGDINLFDGQTPGFCFVHPTNSKGILDGELDKRMTEMFPELQSDVTLCVASSFQFPVFSTLFTPCANQRYVASVSCMTNPGPPSVRNSSGRNAFFATYVMLSALVEAVRSGTGIHTVIVPGMCAGRRRNRKQNVAMQMRDAFHVAFVQNKLLKDRTQAAHPRLFVHKLFDTY